MARIRTIKPDFFAHWNLYQAEIESGLPLRVAYAGLWTQADREGLFRWVPQQLKLGCLPYDDLDFSRVLDALITRGFLVKYEVEGVEFGWIPTFHKHQVINNRERDSVLPKPNGFNDLTRERRVNDACPTPLKHAQAERKGRERKGKERNKTPPTPPEGEVLPRPGFGGDEMQKAWADWVEFRKQKKKPLTKLAAEKSILMLHAAFTDGYCPVAVIEKSIINGWQGLFPPKEGDKKIYRPEKRGFVC